MAELRVPSSYVATDEVIIVPRSEVPLYSRVMIDDDNGIMQAMRADINRWQEEEIYLDQWGLEKTGIFQEVPLEEKKKRISRDILRYADKRLSGEVKKADKDSGLYKVGQAQKALSPTTTVSLFSGYSVKFRFRALQGKTTLLFKNPYVDSYMDITFGGRQEFVTEKRFDHGFRAAVNIRFDQSSYFTTLEQQLTDTIMASLISEQSLSSPAFGSDSDRRILVQYYRAF